MKPGTIVKDKTDEKIGMVVIDTWGLCSPEEIPVQFEGNDAFTGTPEQSLVILHEPDDIAVSHKGCGLGQGERCCTFPIVGGHGGNTDLRCGRGSEFHEGLLQLATDANRRIPEKLYPNCYLPPESK